MTRDENMKWCKERALAYLPGSPEDAVASMSSDLDKHPETRAVNDWIMSLGLMYLMNKDIAGVRRWIEGFN